MLFQIPDFTKIIRNWPKEFLYFSKVKFEGEKCVESLLPSTPTKTCMYVEHMESKNIMKGKI